MIFRPAFRSSLAALCCAALIALQTVVRTLPAGAATLPRLEADALGGNHVVLPTDALGEPIVLLVAFGKRPQHDVAAWSRKVLDDHLDAHAHVYVVVVVDDAALVGRRHILKVVRAAAVGSETQMESSVLVTFDGKPWRALFPNGDADAAGVVVCNASGAIVYAQRAHFNTANLAEVEAAARR